VTQDTESTPSENELDRSEEGPGWMPAVLAGTILMGIIGFIFCAFSTWILFQKRTEFAIRTLRGSYIADIEQSLLDPATKSVVLKEIETLAADLERGEYEDWQAAGMMQRLQRLPVLQWGELQAIDSFLRKRVADREANGESSEEEAEELKQLSRLRRAVELGKSTSFEFEDVLQPVRVADSSGHQLVQPLTMELIREVVHRARLASDQADIPDQSFDNVQIESIVRREIERGASEGSF
jgi:hypothetical protein